MVQADVIKLLEKRKEPLAVSEIAVLLCSCQKKISRALSKMLKYKEIHYIEIDRYKAMKRYNCKHRMKLWYVKGFFMATIDLNTGKIHGCEEGSRTWWHEKGHQVFNDTELGSKISYYQFFFMMMAVFFGCLYLLIGWFPIKLFAFLNALGMLVSYLYEETYCWVYSFKHYNK